MNLSEKIILNENNIYNISIYSYNDYIYKNSILVNKYWDEDIVNEIVDNIPEETDFLDIGANIGLISLGIISKAKEKEKKLGNIHCFEPDLTLVNLLSYNTSNSKNVYIYPFPISDKQEICQISSLPDNMGCNYIYHSKNPEGENQYDYSTIFNIHAHNYNNKFNLLSTSLDSILFQFNNKIGVIKIDVEGYEAKVLLGAKELIKIHKPIIVIEIFKTNLELVFQLLGNYGYKYCRKIPNELYQNEDYIFFPNYPV